MKLFDSSINKENPIATLAELVTCLGLKVNSSTLRSLKNHPNYPSLSALSDTLNDWSIDNMSITSSVDQLPEVPYPAIAHLHKHGGHFVVLKKLENDLLHYIDPEIGVIKETVNEFEKKWTSVLLLVQANEKSGEENYQEKRKQEVFQKVSSYVVFNLLAFTLLLPLTLLSWSASPFYLLKVAGAVFSFLLLQKQFGGTNATVNAFCNMGSKADCGSVINFQTEIISTFFIRVQRYWTLETYFYACG